MTPCKSLLNNQITQKILNETVTVHFFSLQNQLSTRILDNSVYIDLVVDALKKNQMDDTNHPLNVL